MKVTFLLQSNLLLKGNPMVSKLPIVSALLALSALPARHVQAHHEADRGRLYLASWIGSDAPRPNPAETGICLEGRYWDRGFVSIYPHGTPILDSR